jgi:hypothetical protein
VQSALLAGRARLHFRRAEDTISDRLRGDQMLMVADVLSGSGPGMARELFRLPLRQTWDVSPEDNRFLVELPDGMPDNATLLFVFVTN